MHLDEREHIAFVAMTACNLFSALIDDELEGLKEGPDVDERVHDLQLKYQAMYKDRARVGTDVLGSALAELRQEITSLLLDTGEDIVYEDLFEDKPLLATRYLTLCLAAHLGKDLHEDDEGGPKVLENADQHTKKMARIEVLQSIKDEDAETLIKLLGKATCRFLHLTPASIRGNTAAWRLLATIFALRLPGTRKPKSVLYTLEAVDLVHAAFRAYRAEPLSLPRERERRPDFSASPPPRPRF
jgi:hypothetical protein